MRTTIFLLIALASSSAFSKPDVSGRWTLKNYRCDSGSAISSADAAEFYDLEFNEKGFSKRKAFKNGCAYQSLAYSYDLVDGTILPSDRREKIFQVIGKCGQAVESLAHLKMKEIKYQFDGTTLSLRETESSDCMDGSPMWIDFVRD